MIFSVTKHTLIYHSDREKWRDFNFNYLHSFLCIFVTFQILLSRVSIIFEEYRVNSIDLKMDFWNSWFCEFYPHWTSIWGYLACFLHLTFQENICLFPSKLPSFPSLSFQRCFLSKWWISSNSWWKNHLSYTMKDS